LKFLKTFFYKRKRKKSIVKTLVTDYNISNISANMPLHKFLEVKGYISR